MPQYQAGSVSPAATDEAEVATVAAAIPGTDQDNALPSILIRHHYAVALVEPADVGDGSDSWYQYVLASGASRITGFHRGTLEEVTEYANVCAEAFNLRNQTGKSSRVTASTLKNPRPAPPRPPQA